MFVLRDFLSDSGQLRQYNAGGHGGQTRHWVCCVTGRGQGEGDGLSCFWAGTSSVWPPKGLTMKRAANGYAKVEVFDVNVGFLRCV